MGRSTPHNQMLVSVNRPGVFAAVSCQLDLEKPERTQPQAVAPGTSSSMVDPSEPVLSRGGRFSPLHSFLQLQSGIIAILLPSASSHAIEWRPSRPRSTSKEATSYTQHPGHHRAARKNDLVPPPLRPNTVSVFILVDDPPCLALKPTRSRPWPSPRTAA